MEKNVNAPENLKVKVSKFKSDLSFNEWAKELKVSSQYTEYQPLYQGNQSCGIHPQFPEPTIWDDLKRLLLIRY
jgi:hypothetical protein